MFKDSLKEAFKEGLLLLAKYGILIIVILYVFNIMNQTREMAMNGNAAAMAIRAFQEKGYLPQFNELGRVPEKK